MTGADTLHAFLIYGLPAFAACAGWGWLRARRNRQTLGSVARARELGLERPASLHPAINPNRCLGCGTCIPACPEKTVLGLLDGKAIVVEPASCVGHGACRTACPTDAITLVLGTEERPVEIPALGPDFQTSVPGVFVAGELGGMGLIRNAVEQGRQVVASIAAGRDRGPAELDVVIVGAGPAGLAAAFSARERGLRAVVVEQDRLGGAVAHYPRRKLVLTAPVELPGAGRIEGRISKEQLLEVWTRAQRESGLEIHTSERLTGIERLDGGLLRVTTDRGHYEAGAVVLAIGRRGTPRRLGVPGEDCPKVAYALEDPADHRGERVLVVGGGDSALEAAIGLAGEPGTTVTLCYRGAAFARAKAANRERISELSAEGRLAVWLESQVTAISPDQVRIETPGGEKLLDNDRVVVCAGGVLPTALLQSLGVETEVKRGAPIS
ncbi:MAG: NAD(P)-binding domain-containing protein [Myxococcota bacterium]